MSDVVVRTAVIDKATHVYRCWRTTDGIDAVRIGCEHATPREASEHVDIIKSVDTLLRYEASAREES